MTKVMRWLSRIVFHNLARLHQLPMAHTSGGCTSSLGSLLARLGTTWHLCDSALKFKMGHVVFVEV